MAFLTHRLIASGLLAALPFAATAHEVDATRLPLGDGNVASAPQAGAVFACRTSFDPAAPGAVRDGPWLNRDGTYDMTRKIAVSGAVEHVSELEIQVIGGLRVISGNALPDHPTGVFPISRVDPAFDFDRNPDRIRAQRLRIDLPARPEIAAEPTCLPQGVIGVMLTGAVLFNALDASGRDAKAHEILDRCQGHPQQSGLYHYHGATPCAGESETGLIGYALDGFGIFAAEEGDKTIHRHELDECGGHVGMVMWDGRLTEIYHYHATEDYPYTLGCFRGTPVTTDLGEPGPRGPGAEGTAGAVGTGPLGPSRAGTLGPGRPPPPPPPVRP